jgi:hypothetical protein
MEATQLMIVLFIFIVVTTNVLTFVFTTKKYVKPLRFEKSELMLTLDVLTLLLEQKRVNKHIDVTVGSTFHVPYNQFFLDSIHGKQFAIMEGPNSKGEIIIKMVGDSSRDTYKTTVDRLHMMIWPTSLNNLTHKFLKNG